MGEKKEAMEARVLEEIIKTRGRFDETETTGQPQRRLDAISRLLAGNSECVATAIIDGQLIIAANDLYVTSQENNTIKYIGKVQEYFQSFKTASPDKRKKAFLDFCTAKRIAYSVQSEVWIPDGLLAEAAAAVLHHEEGEKINLYNYFYSKKQDAAITGFVYGAWTNLYRDFKKIEDTLAAHASTAAATTANTDDNFVDSNEEVIELCQAFSSESQIIQQETKLDKEPRVHAEAQILAYLIKKYEANELGRAGDKVKNVYLGISKLCCLNCRTLLQAANKVFSDKQIPIRIQFRGWHDLAVKWRAPSIFTKSYQETAATSSSSSSTSTLSLADEIGQLAWARYQELKDVKMKGKVTMHHEASDSDTDSMGESDKNEALNQLKSSLKHLKSFTGRMGDSLKETIDKMTIAEYLYPIQLFTRLWRNDADNNMTLEEQKEIFIKIFVALEAKLSSQYKITEDLLLEILTEDALVGKVSQYFTGFKLDDSLEQKAKTEGNLGASSSSSSSSSAPVIASSSSSTIGTLTGPISGVPKSSLAQTTRSKEE